MCDECVLSSYLQMHSFKNKVMIQKSSMKIKITTEKYLARLPILGDLRNLNTLNFLTTLIYVVL